MSELIKSLNVAIIIIFMILAVLYLNKFNKKLLTFGSIIVFAPIVFLLLMNYCKLNMVSSVLAEPKFLAILITIFLLTVLIPVIVKAIKCGPCQPGPHTKSPHTAEPHTKGPHTKAPVEAYNPMTDAFKVDDKFVIPTFEITLSITDDNKKKLDSYLWNHGDEFDGQPLLPGEDLNSPHYRPYHKISETVISKYTTGRGQAMVNTPLFGGTLTVKTPDGKAIDGLSNLIVDSVKVRGNVSRNDAYQSFTLKLDNKISMFKGFNKMSKYVLYCPYNNDPTFIRDAISMGMGNLLGYKASPVQFINLVITDWEFGTVQKGIYVLMETVVDLSKDAYIVAHTDKFAWDERNMLVGVFPGKDTVIPAPDPDNPDYGTDNCKYICDSASVWNSISHNGHTEGGNSWVNKYNDSNSRRNAASNYFATQAITFAIDKPGDQDPEDSIAIDANKKIIRMTDCGLQCFVGEPKINPGKPATVEKFFGEGKDGTKKPKPKEDTQKAMRFLQCKIQKFTKFLLCPGSDFSGKTYADFIDVDSFIWFIILAEVRNDNDTYRHNQYITIDTDKEDAKISLGPMWDMDLSMCNFTDHNGCDTNFFRYDYVSNTNQGGPNETEPARGVGVWVKKLMDNADFKKALIAKWQSSNLIDITNKLIDFYVSNYFSGDSPFIKPVNQGGNFNVTGPLSQACRSCQDYNAAINQLRNWLGKRFDWLQDTSRWGPINSGPAPPAPTVSPVVPGDLFPLGQAASYADQLKKLFSKDTTGALNKLNPAWQIANPDKDKIPTFYTFAKPEMINTVKSWIGRCTGGKSWNTLPYDQGKEQAHSYASQCQGDSSSDTEKNTRLTLTGASGFRDKINIFQCAYPNLAFFPGREVDTTGFKDEYIKKHPDPFAILIKLGGKSYHDGSQYKDKPNPKGYPDLVTTSYMVDLLMDPNRKVFKDVTGKPNLTWSQYAQLDDILWKPEDQGGFGLRSDVLYANGQNGADSNQYWDGKDPSDAVSTLDQMKNVKTSSNAYNVFTQLLKVQMKNLIVGKETCLSKWYSIDKIIKPDEIITWLQNKSSEFKLPTHDKYHDYRKALRAFVRLLAFYPQALPTLYYPVTQGKQLLELVPQSSGIPNNFLYDPYYSVANKDPKTTDTMAGKVWKASDSYRQKLSSFTNDEPSILSLGSSYYPLGSDHLNPLHGLSGWTKDNDGITNGFDPNGDIGDIVYMLGVINDCIDVGSCKLVANVPDETYLKKAMTLITNGNNDALYNKLKASKPEGLLDILKADKTTQLLDDNKKNPQKTSVTPYDIYKVIMSVNNAWTSYKEYLQTIDIAKLLNNICLYFPGNSADDCKIFSNNQKCESFEYPRNTIRNSYKESYSYSNYYNKGMY